jgi:hypothetical protein
MLEALWMDVTVVAGKAESGISFSYIILIFSSIFYLGG